MNDLIAERAAQLYNSLHAYIPTDRCVYASELNQVEVEKAEDIAKLTAALKTSRQEALREAAKVVRTEMWDDYAKGRLIVIAKELDRLASEGG